MTNLRHTAAIVILSWASINSAGCIPIPWVYHRTPNVYGVLTHNGAFVGGAQIRYSFDANAIGCTPIKEETTSSEDGEFYLAGTLSFFRVVILTGPVDTVQRHRLCIDTPDGQHFEKALDLNWGGPLSLPPNSADNVTADCELNQPEWSAFPYDRWSDAKFVHGNLPGWFVMKPPVQQLGADWRPKLEAPLSRWSRSAKFRTYEECERERLGEHDAWFGKNGNPGMKDRWVAPPTLIDSETAELINEQCISSEDPRFKKPPK